MPSRLIPPLAVDITINMPGSLSSTCTEALLQSFAEEPCANRTYGVVVRVTVCHKHVFGVLQDLHKPHAPRSGPEFLVEHDNAEYIVVT